MIDTLKIYCSISKQIYNVISQTSWIKTSYKVDTQERAYIITTNTLDGTYDSRMSIRLKEINTVAFSGYNLEVECSYHKIILGHNCFNGFNNIQSIVFNIIKMLNKNFNIKLPSLKHWFLQRIDISRNFNLDTNINVANYINLLSKIKYPRRKMQFYQNESVYSSGVISTVKIYNKLLEFRKHDKNKLKEYIDVQSFEDKIKGIVRFEAEFRKRYLQKFFNEINIKIIYIDNKKFNEMWRIEFMKILKFNEQLAVGSKEKVFKKLVSVYGNTKGNLVYEFFIRLKAERLRRSL